MSSVSELPIEERCDGSRGTLMSASKTVQIFHEHMFLVSYQTIYLSRYGITPRSTAVASPAIALLPLALFWFGLGRTA